MFRDGNEICKLISRGRARKNEPNCHENSRDREFSLCSALSSDDNVADDAQATVFAKQESENSYIYLNKGNINLIQPI